MQSGTKKHSEMNIFVRFAVVVFVIASLFSSVKILMKYNDYRDKTEKLQIEKEEYVENIERIEYELSLDFDDEYVIRIAKEKLNLCMPGESVYYNDLD